MTRLFAQPEAWREVESLMDHFVHTHEVITGDDKVPNSVWGTSLDSIVHLLLSGLIADAAWSVSTLTLDEVRLL